MNRRSPARGFSLVEVVLAIGIISFALVALLGIVTVGTTASSESKRDTEFSQIFEVIAGQLRTKPYDIAQPGSEGDDGRMALPALDDAASSSTEFFLDDQNRVVAAGAANKRVQLSVLDAVPLGYQNADGDPQPAPPRERLALVRVEIADYPERSAGESIVFCTEICPLQQ